jgi:vitamin B12 transporter
MPVGATFTGGAEYMLEKERSGNRSGAVGATATPTDGFVDDRHNVAYYSELLGTVAERLSYNLSGRRDDNSEFGAINTFRLGTSAPLVAGVRLRASLATAFNAPAFNQIQPTTFTKASPDLQPERSRSWELGVERIFGADRFRVGGDYFNQKFSQLIQFVNGGPPNFLGSYANLTGASSNGFEGEAELRPIDRVHVTGSFTVVTPRVREISPTYGGSQKVGDALLRRPTHSGALGVSYGDAIRSFGIAAAYVGKRPDMDFSQFPSPTLTLPSYVKLDLSARSRVLALSPGNELSLTARLENALDKKYQDVIGFPAPGRVILVGASISGRR